MSRITNICFAAIAVGVAVFAGGVAVADNKATVKVPDGFAFSDFAGYETWQVVSVSQKSGIIDVIVGNPTIIEAFKSGIPGNGKPFPDGAKMAKIHWNSKTFSNAFPVNAPDTLHDIDFMARDSKRFTGPDHWGFAQFNYDTKADSFSPLGKGTGCGTACHQRAAKTDFVFTEFPKR